MYLLQVVAEGAGVENSFRVSCFAGGSARGWGPVSGSFLSWTVGRRLICWVKISSSAEGLGGLLGALDLDSFVMGEGERAEEDFIGRTVLAERRMASKVPEGLNIGDLRPFAIPFEEVSEI